MRRTHSTRYETRHASPNGTTRDSPRDTTRDSARDTTRAATRRGRPVAFPLPLTPRAPRTPRAALTMDVMPPQRASGSAPVPTSPDPRRWLGLLLATLARLTARAVRRMSP